MESGEAVVVEVSQKAKDFAQKEDDHKKDAAENSKADEKPTLTPEQAQKELQGLKSTLLRQLRITLMVGECLAQLRKQDELDALVERIVAVVMESKSMSFDDILKEAESFAKEPNYLQALIAFQCACKLSKAEKLPYESLFDIGDCIDKVDNLFSQASDKKFRSLGAFCRVNVHFMDVIVKDLDEIDEAFEDLLVRVKVRCLGNKADCLGPLEMEDQSLELYGSCVTIMREHFGDDASSHRYFGEFLNNIGHIHARRREFIMAQSYFEEALAARVSAQDYKTEAEKQQAIAGLSNVLTQIEQIVARQQVQAEKQQAQAMQQPGPSGINKPGTSSARN